MKNIAIIPARSGSKGLKDKNIQDLNGKPLIAYTIEAAQKSNIFDEIFVSTDSELYAQISEQFGAKAHPLRDERLSTDTSSSFEVILDVLGKFQGFDNFCLLQPTSPLRNEKHILQAYQILLDKKATSVVSLSKSKSPNIINTINENGTIHNFLQLNQATYARQKEEFYSPNGAIFFSNVDYFEKNLDFYGEKSYPLIMDKKSSIDIDDEIDFKLTEIILGGY